MTGPNMRKLNDVVIFIWVFFAPLHAGPIDKHPENRVTIVSTSHIVSYDQDMILLLLVIYRNKEQDS